MDIILTEAIKRACPVIKLAVLECDVLNSVTPEALNAEMDSEVESLLALYTIDQVNKIPQITATRQVYKMLGKDPNRYRPSAEALCRRIIRGIGIYRVSTLVDIINLVSIRSGISIGGFDMDKIEGDVLELGVGKTADMFEAIGRGLLNIEGLPVYRDNTGGIGTPTSDNERTKISENTSRLLIVFNGYAGNAGLSEAVAHMLDLLARYGHMKHYQLRYFS